MKILYIAAEHVSGTLSLFKAEHERRGDICRFVTFWHSHWDFPDDICLNLPLMPDRAWVLRLRRLLQASEGHAPGSWVAGDLPLWQPGTLARTLFKLRDQWLWPRIHRQIRAYDLDDFDIVHLDGGLDFTRDARFVRAMRRKGKHVAAFYHGTDLRNRGMVPAIDEQVELRLTSEWDLLEFDPRLHYLYLPFDTSVFPPREYHFHTPIRICHATRNPYKGTSYVIEAVRVLSERYPVELVLLQDLSHDEALRRKADSDIVVDQLTNAGGWGYGMSSVEACAMGLPVVTNIPEKMAAPLGPHPFVQADPDSIRDVLERLITDEVRCRRLGAEGRAWVRERHDVRSVGEQLYRYYREAGWLKTP
jgi:hypothetical protein